ncbi:MAG TPA: hypothetical protein VGQ91_19265 [Ideonella sp.]|nr:hypothetical protein [Ideonella sp.]
MNLNLIARRVSLIAAAAFTLAGAAHAAGTPSNHGIGVNLNAFDYYSPDMPTINQLRHAGGWYTQCSYPKDAGCTNFAPGASGWDTLEESKMKVDVNGYPTSLPAQNDTSVKYRRVSALMFQDDSRVHPAGKYIVTYEGAGTIEYAMAGTKVAAESQPGRDVVNVTNSDNVGMLLTISATDPNNHLRNIRVLPPGGVCSLDQALFALTSADCTAKGKGTLITFENLPGRMWHPAFVADLKGFRTLRFLDWNKANSSMLANWLDRPNTSDATWTGPYGVPTAAMLSLANEVGADPWINLPTRATDDYVLRFARQAHSTLAPGLNLILEYSNEPWNYGFNNSLWMKDQAAAKWPDQVAKGISPFELQYSWYGMRAAQMCQIVKAEFGADASRVKCVINGQASNSWVSQQQLNCKYAVADLGGKTCAQIVDALAVAPYFGEYIGDMSVRSTVATWFSQPDGGVAKLFEEILAQDANGNKVTPPLYGKTKESFLDGALARAKSWMTSNKTEAAAHGLPLMGYEGGQHLVMYPGDTDQRWLNLMTAANRDPRMGTAYTRTLADWQAVGGQAYALFNHVYHPSKYGVWGLKETQNGETNPKWQAVLPYRDTKQCWWQGCTR